MATHSSILAWEIPQRSLVGYSPPDHKELDTTEWLTHNLCLANGFSSVQFLSCGRLFETPWTAACQASLSITNSQSLLKVMSIELVIPSNNLILCPLLYLPPSIFPSIRIFSKWVSFFASSGQSIGVSASTSVLPMNIQDWFPLGWTGWIFVQSKGLSRVFSNTTVQKHWFFSTQLSLRFNSHIHTWLLKKP